VDANSISYPIGGSSNITVSQNPTSKQLTVALANNISVGTITAAGTVTAPAITLNGNDLQTQLNICTKQYFFTSASASWFNLGTLTTVQNGYNFRLEITNCEGYNANASTNNMIWVHFKTSNGTSEIKTGNDGSNFYGDCVAYYD
jgi:hypothetical protein